MTWFLLIIIVIALFISLRRKSASGPAVEDAVPDEVLAIIMVAIAEAETEEEALSPQELLAIISAAIGEYEGGCTPA